MTYLDNISNNNRMIRLESIIIILRSSSKLTVTWTKRNAIYNEERPKKRRD